MQDAPAGRISRRTFVRSLLAAGAVASGGVVAPLVRRGTAAAATRPLAANPDYPVAVDTQPGTLTSGDLLVTDQSSGTVYRVRGDKVEPIVRVATWSHSFLFDTAASLDTQRLWVSLTGLNVPGTSYYFGIRGVGQILEFDLASGAMTRAFQSPDMVDPAGLLVGPDEQSLYVTDFNSFCSHGSLLRLSLEDGSLTVVSADGHVTTPVGLNYAGDHHVVIGVAKMPEVGPAGGSIVLVDLRNGEQTLVHEHPDDLGELIGALRLPGGEFVATRSEWPGQRRSTVFLTTGSGHTPLHEPAYGFFSSGIAWSGSGVWVAESTRRRVLHITPGGAVTTRATIPGEIAGDRIPTASHTLESVTAV